MDIEQTILTYLASNDCIEDTWDFAASISQDHQTVVGIMKSLLADQYVVDTPLSTSFWTVTGEGDIMAADGSPEYLVRDLDIATASATLTFIATMTHTGVLCYPRRRNLPS